MKKATANNLTFENIAHESYRKGIDVIGVVDFLSPFVLEDINELLFRGELVEKEGGGMEYRGRQSLILEAEIETHEKHGCSSHSLCFFSTLKHITDFSNEMRKYIKNILTMSLMSRFTGQELFNKVGHKTIDKLINHFGSEMKVLHDTTFEELKEVRGGGYCGSETFHSW